MLFSGKKSREHVAAKTDSEVCDATLSRNSLFPAPGDIEIPNLGSWEESMAERGKLE